MTDACLNCERLKVLRKAVDELLVGRDGAANAVLACVATLLREHDLAVPSIFACAGAMTLARTNARLERTSAAVLVLSRLIRSATAPVPNRKLREALRDLEMSRTEQRQLSNRLLVSKRQVGRLVKRHTSLTLRQWRWALRIRPSLPVLLGTREHVAQVAYGCGYARPSQFDRDFRYIFGLSPRQLRRLLGDSSGIADRALQGAALDTPVPASESGDAG